MNSASFLLGNFFGSSTAPALAYNSICYGQSSGVGCILGRSTAPGGLFNLCSSGNTVPSTTFPDSYDHGPPAVYTDILVYPHPIPDRHANPHSSHVLADGRHPAGRDHLLRGA